MLIDLRPMKRQSSNFPIEIANLILSEPDHLDKDEFFAKSDVWFKALRQAQAGEKSLNCPEGFRLHDQTMIV